MSWIFSPFRRTTVTPTGVASVATGAAATGTTTTAPIMPAMTLTTSSIQLKFFVMYQTADGALYVAYVKNTGSTAIQDLSFNVMSQQTMQAYHGNWVITGCNAVCDIGVLQPGDERVASLDIAGDTSSAMIATTTNPPLSDPNSGMAQASYQRQVVAPAEITNDDILTHVKTMRARNTR